jgi:hypothetical protein
MSDTIVLATNINESLKNEFGDFLKKQRKDIDQKKIESFLMQNPYIEQAQVYQTLKGVLNIEIKQREPIVRIYTLRNKEYYIDKLGKVILIDDNQLTDVVVASGNVDVNNSNLDKNLDTIDIENKKGFDKTLYQAIIDNDIGAGGEWVKEKQLTFTAWDNGGYLALDAAFSPMDPADVLNRYFTNKYLEMLGMQNYYIIDFKNKYNK